MNATRKLKKSSVGVELVRLLAAEGNRVFSTEQARDLSARAGIKKPYLLEALHHLHRNGWIVPLRRGFYSLASAIPGVPVAHEFEIAMVLVHPAAISHWSALHYNGLTEQIPRRVFVLTTTEARIPRARGKKAKSEGGGYVIGEAIYQFIQVKPDRFFGTEEVWVGDARVTMTNPARTLLDGLMRPQFCGDFSEVLHAFQTASDHLLLSEIISYALRLDTATIKRLGWVLENQGIDSDLILPLLHAPIRGYRPLDPSSQRAGPCNRRWMIQENLPGKVLL
ncbi:MAG: type IV toxin-antitoxin system AbiEi family antitoxin domain-containing protein [Candidatus Brocadiia bacterium]